MNNERLAEEICLELTDIGDLSISVVKKVLDANNQPAPALPEEHCQCEIYEDCRHCRANTSVPENLTLSPLPNAVDSDGNPIHTGISGGTTNPASDVREVVFHMLREHGFCGHCMSAEKLPSGAMCAWQQDDEHGKGSYGAGNGIEELECTIDNCPMITQLKTTTNKKIEDPARTPETVRSWRQQKRPAF